MAKEKKSVFMINSRNIAERFEKLLEENLEIEILSEPFGYQKRVSVSKDDYQKALFEGCNIASLNHWDIHWINAYGEKRPVGYISVMYGILPKSREADMNWEWYETSDYCPIDMKEYIEKLRAFLGGRHLKIVYDSADNAIEFLVKGSFDDYDLIKQQCEGFHHVTKNSPFVKMIFLEKDGTLIKNKEKQKKEETNFKSYFIESMFLDGLLRPEGSNIAPKTDTDPDSTTGYKYNSSRYGTRSFDTSFVSTDDLTENLKGTFLVYEEKDYNYYWNNEKEQKTPCKSKMRFTMLDNGSFESVVNIHDSETVSINTSINLIRNVVGYNFDGKSVRDGLFKDFAHEDGRKNFKLTEYFKKIANGTRLLHYSDSSDFFEVYDLPSGWNIIDGISNLGYPKVFDDIEFDDADKDLDEINRILATRKVDKGTAMIKKTDDNIG